MFIACNVGFEVAEISMSDKNLIDGVVLRVHGHSTIHILGLGRGPPGLLDQCFLHLVTLYLRGPSADSHARWPSPVRRRTWSEGKAVKEICTVRRIGTRSTDSCHSPDKGAACRVVAAAAMRFRRSASSGFSDLSGFENLEVHRSLVVPRFSERQRELQQLGVVESDNSDNRKVLSSGSARKSGGCFSLDLSEHPAHL